MEYLKKELINKLGNEKNPNTKIVLMPHFCVDNFIKYGQNYTSFLKRMEKLIEQGGGNIVKEQNLRRGGKAANCASALSALGLKSSLIVKTDELGKMFIQKFFKNTKVNLDYVKTNGRFAFTTVLEFSDANIMINETGSLSDFGSKEIKEKEKKIIKEADLVCLSDWGLNKRGTELAQYVFKLVKKGKKGKVFFDPGDPSPQEKKNKKNTQEMIAKILNKDLVDILSVNENETGRYGQNSDFSKAVNSLRKKARVDFHGNKFVKCFFSKQETKRIPMFKVKPVRLTGAGDSWNAGNIYGEILGLSGELRLLLANAVAAFYISHPEGKHPSKKELINFLQNTGLKK